MPAPYPATGVPLATYNGNPLSSAWRANRTNHLTDQGHIHFGLNTPACGMDIVTAMGNAAAPRYTDYYDAPAVGAAFGNSVLLRLGPRAIDMVYRGGRVAEYNWFIPQGRLCSNHTGTLVAAPLPYCLSVAAYHNFNNAVPVSLGKHVLPVGATISNVAVGGNVRYNNAGAVLPLGAGPLPLNKANCGGLQMGVRWSKTALEYALKHGHTIHFHLDGLGDIAQVIGKAGNYSHNVTTRECRYLHHHWRRFHKAVRFYNGFVHDPSTPHPRNRAYEVHPPWFRYFSTRPHPGSRAIVQAATVHL